MRIMLGLAALLAGLALAAPLSAQDTSNYWPTTTPAPRPKPKPPPGLLQTTATSVKKFMTKALDYNTYLPDPGTTDNSIEDPRLLATKTPSHILKDAIDVARPTNMPKVFIP